MAEALFFPIMGKILGGARQSSKTPPVMHSPRAADVRNRLNRESWRLKIFSELKSELSLNFYKAWKLASIFRIFYRQ